MYLVEFLEFLTHFLKLSVTGPMRVARWHSRGRAEVIAPISDQRRSLKNSRAIAYNRAKSVYPSAASLPVQSKFSILSWQIDLLART